MQSMINEWDDSAGMPAPCQPIGCDNGHHLPGCVFACGNYAIVAQRASLRPDEPQRPLTESELIHQRALERAIGERRNDRLAFVAGTREASR